MKAGFILLAIIILSTDCRAANDSIPEKRTFWGKVVDNLYSFVKNFSHVDTNYIEPQHYNYTLMLQNTNTYEIYRISTPKGNVFTFAPQPSIKLGPYAGWRWIFLGYTIDLTHLSGGNAKKEFDLSLYSSQIGIDLFYRKTGNDYKMRYVYLGDNVDTSPMKNISYDGLTASIKGFNIYYIFNHNRFSYPAAFSQSTVQRRSCGSPMVGIGYTKHTLSVDWKKLNSVISNILGSEIADKYADKNVISGKIKYTDVSLSGGYGYNWVFARNWLFASSLSLALGYKHTTSDVDHENFSFRDFSIKNMNIDGVGRFGIVWNNTKWYFGASTILHSYNYSKKQFSTNNFFGSLNIYIGFNFDKK